MPFKRFKKFNNTKPQENVVNVNLSEEMTIERFMRETFGCDAVSSVDMPSDDEASMVVIFDYDEMGVQ